MELPEERETILDPTLASVKNRLAGLKVENASLRWSRGKVDEIIVALEKDVGLALKAVAESAQHNVMQVAGLVESAFSDH